MCRYRVADNVNLPLRIIPAVQEEGRARVSVNLKLSADFSYKLFGSNIVVKVGRHLKEKSTKIACAIKQSSPRYPLYQVVRVDSRR